ncbi:TylF/MycF family methyltransferase [bacterium]|nr:TylF/MycF family methyltransferase [bacterium]
MKGKKLKASLKIGLKKIRKGLKKIFELSGLTIHKIARFSYDRDGLKTNHNHDFMVDPDFCKAYERGVSACGGVDWRWQWRVHIGLWAAYSASKLKGDFVECGVQNGFLSSAIMEYLNWDSLNKTFYLMDTFSGIDERYICKEERSLKHNKGKNFSAAESIIETVRNNFSQWKNIQIIVGAVPETLSVVKTHSIAYLHIDMNNALPEVAAFNYFWERLIPGAFVLFDDYADHIYKLQKIALDVAAAAKNLKIASLPTGQGLLIKPF